MHTDHDLDLVIALADGSLADPAPAEELIAACSECAETYEAYLTVRAAVAAAPTPAMTELERRRLSNSLWAEIAQDETATAAVATRHTAPDAPTRRTGPNAPTRRTGPNAPTRRTPWWYRVAPVAAALVVVVGVAANLTGDSASTTFQNEGGEMSDTADESAAGAEESATDMLALPETTTAADGAAPPAEEMQQRRLVITREDLDTAIDDFAQRAETGDVPELPADEPCVMDEVDGQEVVASESVILDGEPVLFVALGSSADVTAVLVYYQSDCTVLYDPR
jgi:hypothetical protein